MSLRVGIKSRKSLITQAGRLDRLVVLWWFGDGMII